MVCNSGPINSKSCVDADSIVFSVSGLSINKEGEMATNLQ